MIVDLVTCLIAVAYTVIAAGMHGDWRFVARGIGLVLVAVAMVGVGLFLMIWLGKIDTAFALPGFVITLASLIVAFMGAFGDEAGEVMEVWRLVAGFALVYLYFQLINIPVSIAQHYEDKI